MAVFDLFDGRMSRARARLGKLFIMTSRNEFPCSSARQSPGGRDRQCARCAVGGTPPFRARFGRPPVERTQALHRLLGSWGPMVLGHTHPQVVEAVQGAAARALSFGAPTESEIELAEAICRLVPSVEMVRLVSSGTEATMSAIRLARGHSGRSLIVKFEGCYHGHADSLLVKAGSGALTFGNPSSAGVPPETAAHTLVLDFNDTAQVENLFKEKGNQIACVIVEPVAGTYLVFPAGSSNHCAKTAPPRRSLFD